MNEDNKIFLWAISLFLVFVFLFAVLDYTSSAHKIRLCFEKTQNAELCMGSK